MLGILTFILVFGIIVVVHEFGHFYFAKKSGILVREFAIGMGPKIFAHIGKDGTAYTIRILPLGGYVRMAGWGDDTTEIKTGTPVSLTLTDDGKVKRINLSGKKLDQTALPMQVTQFDFEDKLFIRGLVLEEEKTFAVDHDATVVEADGTEVRIAPLDVQYQNATIWGKLITNFAGPMNNFILGVVVFWILIFMQGGVRDVDTNQFHIMPQGALAKVGVPETAQITKIGSHEVSNWESLIQAVESETKDKTAPTLDVTISEKGSDKQVTVTPEESQGRYLLGVQPGIKSDFLSMFVGGLAELTKHYGGIKWIIDKTSKLLKGPKSASVGIAALAALTDAATANNTVAIIVTGEIAKEISEKYKIDPRRTASFLDIFSCIMQGFIPYGAQFLLIASLTKNAVNPTSMIPYNWYLIILGIMSLISVVFPSYNRIVCKGEWNWEHMKPEQEVDKQ